MREAQADAERNWRRGMRKHLIWVMAIGGLAAFVGAAVAVPNTGTVTGAFSPSKLPKHRRAPVSLFVDVAATNPSNPYQIPNPTTLAKVDFDKDGAFQQKGLPTCDPNEFTSTSTTAEAKAACADSLVGGGSAQLAIPVASGAPPLTVTAQTTAFNGKNKTTVFHSYNSLSGAQTLIGKLTKAEPGVPPNGAGPGYGITLTVQVPPLAGGTAVITEFNTKVKKVYRYNGKKLSLYTARCGPDKRLRIQARFTDNQGQVTTASASKKCKQKNG
jgi:hypothetical protein